MAEWIDQLGGNSNGEKDEDREAAEYGLYRSETELLYDWLDQIDIQSAAEREHRVIAAGKVIEFLKLEASLFPAEFYASKPSSEA